MPLDDRRAAGQARHLICRPGVAIADYDDGDKIQSVGSHHEVSGVAMIAGDEDPSALPIPGMEQARDDAVGPF